MTGPGPRSLLVATAGHVDHGKSTIVRHLTGVDPDRLAEERRRGLTLDLGFAVAPLPSGAEVSFVDVPGHARYVATMVAGVGPVPAVLLVVSAVEGWRAQTEEHLRILDVLGVAAGLVVVTRAADADADRRVAVVAEVERRLAASTLAGAEVVVVDLPAGIGHQDLVAGLERLVATVPPVVDRGRPRLWVDRAFTVTGAGTVVTGTLVDGALTSGAEVEVWSPGAVSTARARGIEVHGQPVGRAEPGHRVALNLAGITPAEVGRGSVVVEPGRWHPATTPDVLLTVFADAPPVRSGRGALLATIGTREVPVRARVIGAPRVEPGAEAPARLAVAAPVPLLPGDRIVVRDSGRATTIGGAVVLDVDPARPVGRAAPTGAVAQVVADRGWVTAAGLERRTGTVVPVTVPGWVASPEQLAADQDRLGAAVAEAGWRGLALDQLDPRDRLVLAARPDIVVTGGRARERAATDLRESSYLRAVLAQPFRPPSPDEHGCAPDELRALRAAGAIAHHDGTYFAATALDRAAGEVARLLAERPDGVTVAEVRDHLGTTRRWALPLLALLDRRGVTRRHGVVRVAGPNLPPAE